MPLVKFSPDLPQKLKKALENTRRFAEGTTIKEIKEVKRPLITLKKPLIKKIKDWTREVNARIERAKGKILSVF